MTIIVKHKKTGNEYILLELNLSNGKFNLPNRFLNDIFTKEERESAGSVAICDSMGNIFSCYMEDLIVSEIDGKKPGEIIPQQIIPSIAEELEDKDVNEEIEPEDLSNPDSEVSEQWDDDENLDPDKDSNEDDWI